MPKKNIEYLRDLSAQIDDLYDTGKNKQAQALLNQALKEAKKINKAYFLFFQGEWAGYVESNLEKRNDLFAQAVATRSEDYFLLRQLGASLGVMNRKKEALEWHEKALKIKPDDYHSIRHRGVALAKLGREEEALEWYNKALKIKPNDYHSMRNKGVALSKLGREKEALEWFDKALKIKPDDYRSMQNKSVALSELGRKKEAFGWIDKALNIKPDGHRSFLCLAYAFVQAEDWKNAYDAIRKALELTPKDAQGEPRDKKITYWHEYILARLPKKVRDKEEPKKDVAPAKESKEKWSGELQSIVDMVQEEFGDLKDKFEQDKKQAEKRLEEFLAIDPPHPKNPSLLLVLRRWNSFTPAIPSSGGEKNIGGGYFIYHNGRGTVIDPGYNFIENFWAAGGKLRDINNIILTHAYNDHTNDFESLLSLFYKYNEKYNPDSPDYFRVKIFMNTGSLLKFSGMLNLRGAEYIEDVFTMTEGNIYNLDEDLALKVLPAYHDEVVTKKRSVGLLFSVGKDKRNILFSSDTGLFPQKKDPGDPKKDIANTSRDEITTRYLKHGVEPGDIDVLIPHIGSIQKYELEKAKMGEKYRQIYPNHLGVLGTARLITGLHPKLAVVSEFGEELRNCRDELMRLLIGVVEKYCKDNSLDLTKVLPGDTGFIYDINAREIFCEIDEKFYPYSKIRHHEHPEEKSFHFVCTSHSENAAKKSLKNPKRETGFFAKLIGRTP